jgi:putative Holliday junction resolvase
MPDTPETILAFDFGLRRIGVAVGQQITASANPLTVVANSTQGPDWPHIAKLVNEWRPARLIVGMPLHADGTGSETAALVRAFVADLGRFDIDIDTVDERYSSVEARHLLQEERAQGLRGRISKEMIDSAAATLIAERWLKRTHQ